MSSTTIAPAEEARRARWRIPRASAPWLWGTVGAAVGFTGSWIPSYWGDEAASVMSAERSWSSLAGMLGSVDAVHGLYYVMLHLWVGAFGSAEAATRLLSALAAGVMVAGIVVLVRGSASDRFATMAGIAAVVLPRTTSMASEARSYALGAAAAVWLTVLLLRLLRRRAGIGGWIGYAFGAAACMYLFLYLGLLLVVHGLYVAVMHRERFASWLRSTAASVVLATPIVVLGYQQRAQIAFLARRDYTTVRNVLVSQWFGHPVVALFAWYLVIAASAALVVALVRGSAKDRPDQHLTVLALLWLVVPTALLLAGNLISPTYNVRYLSFCTPAAAILIARGAEAVGSLLAAHRRRIVPLGLVIALVVVCVPVYLGQRTPWAKDGGSDWRDVAEYIATNAHHGDAVIFDQTTKPSRDPRILVSLYPHAFSDLQDLALRTSYAERTHLWDAVVPNMVAVADAPGETSIWAVELSSPFGRPADITALLQDDFRVDASHRINRTTVYHLTKE
ncbi:glycosyltransferase family 39 protein [Microbacterium sp. SSW1-49]|uniref:Glycosyltransferase family 39 protein n=1 Tax=Microbacterium croceum TaxID=2851645 RepID=A0ABT0FCI2_9MICO|nr:glycosyltransferase family 39 protein [Microbacterium croceum]MCK2035745.1 glycosyltransferase family 39 protein [Microbacterium croceum]